MARSQPVPTSTTEGAKRKSLKSRNIGTYLGLGLLSLFAVFPVIYVLLLSLQTSSESSSIPPTLIPATPQFGNFSTVAERIDLGKYFFNSLIYATSTTLLLVLISTMAAYALTKLKIPGYQLITSLFVASILFPPEVRAIPLYTMIAAGLGGYLGGARPAAYCYRVRAVFYAAVFTDHPRYGSRGCQDRRRNRVASLFPHGRADEPSWHGDADAL